MHPSPAEIVRTLSSGYVRAEIHTSTGDCLVIPSGTGPTGMPLFLVKDDGAAANSLKQSAMPDTALAINYVDKPPIPCAPSWGSAWISGWAKPVPQEDSRTAAVSFAENNPLPELLDVNNGFTLWQVDIADIQLEQHDERHDVDINEYVNATIDPCYEVECELLLDLYDHHPEVLNALRERMKPRHPDVEHVMPLRITQDGVLVDVHRSHRKTNRYLINHHQRCGGGFSEILHSLTCHNCLDLVQVSL